MEYCFWSTPAYSCWSLQCLPTSSAKGYKNQNQSKAVNTEAFFAFKKKNNNKQLVIFFSSEKAFNFQLTF